MSDDLSGAHPMAPNLTPQGIYTAAVYAINQHGEAYDSDCGTYSGCFCGWDNGTDESNEGYAEHVADALLAVLRGDE